MTIQHAVHDELQKGISKFSAQGGAVIVMKISTGEIISLVSLPDFDPNKNSDPMAKEHFNMAISSAIEPGSSAKIFNTAMALESKKITPFSQFDARFPLKIGRFTIHDFKGKATFLSVEEIMKYSSNIGSAKIALEIGHNAQKKFFKRLRLLDTVSCELLETQRPLYPSPWTEINAMTISYGHGIAFSPLHLITIVSGILNNGILNNPTLLKRINPISNKKIISEKTSDQIKALMRICVTEGTNRFADVLGYCVGGKSGTAEKPKHGKYQKNANYTSFIGAFPMTNPKYSVYVLLDEPQITPETHGYKTAGWNATPIAANIIKRIGPMLKIAAVADSEPNWKDVLRNAK
jgi:cell division protein FtsI (penicillin-binding protein 3)